MRRRLRGEERKSRGRGRGAAEAEEEAEAEERQRQRLRQRERRGDLGWGFLVPGVEPTPAGMDDPNAFPFRPFQHNAAL